VPPTPSFVAISISVSTRSRTFAWERSALNRLRSSFIDEATVACSSVGMQLVRIDSSAENDWISTSVNNGWIAATDSAVEGQWRWADGTLFWTGDKFGVPENGLFNAWKKNYPSGAPANTDCARIDSSSKTWIDVFCGSTLPFICETY